MKPSLIATILIVVTAVAVGAGFHFADVKHDEHIERMKERRRVAELQYAQAEDLLVRQASSQGAAEEVLARWRSRYKYIPTTLNTADMVEYLEGLTRDGFEQFDLTLRGVNEGANYTTHTFNVTGTALYRSFYHLLWHIENNREFYRVHDLSVRHVNVFRKNRATGIDRRIDMVAFSFRLEAYHSRMDGISAPADSLRPIPLAVLQDHWPPADTFTPLVRTDLPPNDEQLLDVDNARLISILGQQAVFEDRYGRHIVLEGDRIYLGEILVIDPVNAFVRVQLNRGDRVETKNIRVAGADEQGTYRTQMGNEIRLAPDDGP